MSSLFFANVRLFLRLRGSPGKVKLIRAPVLLCARLTTAGGKPDRLTSTRWQRSTRDPRSENSEPGLRRGRAVSSGRRCLLCRAPEWGEKPAMRFRTPPCLAPHAVCQDASPQSGSGGGTKFAEDGAGRNTRNRRKQTGENGSWHDSGETDIRRANDLPMKMPGGDEVSQ